MKATAVDSFDFGPLLILAFLAWLGWKLLNRKSKKLPTNTSASAAEGPQLTGPGTFSIDLNGTEHHRAALEQVFASTLRDDRQTDDEDNEDQFTEQEAVATLTPVANNPHDANAIEVRIAGHLIGYFPRGLAGYFRAYVSTNHPNANTFRCLARVTVPLHPKDDWQVELDLPRLKPP